jgi:hypothetical protein
MSTVGKTTSNNESKSDLTELQEKVKKLKAHIDNLKGVEDCSANFVSDQEIGDFLIGMEDYMAQMEDLSNDLLDSERFSEIRLSITRIRNDFHGGISIPAPRVTANNRATAGRPLQRDQRMRSRQKKIVSLAEALCDLMLQRFDSWKQEVSSTAAAGSLDDTDSARASVATFENDFQHLPKQFPAPSTIIPLQTHPSENGKDSPTLGSPSPFTVPFTGDNGETLSNRFSAPETSNSVMRPPRSPETHPSL